MTTCDIEETETAGHVGASPIASATATAAPRRDAPAPVWALLTASLGFLMVTLDTTIVNVALPALGGDLGAGVRGLQWVVDGYTLTFAAALLTGGVLADMVGARRVFLLGITVFALSSLACGSAASTPALVGARLIQGLGAAAVVPSSMALLREAYDGRAARARAISVWAAFGSGAVAAGPVLGGLLIGVLGWRSVFLVNVAVGAVCVGIGRRRVAPSPRRGGRLDARGQAGGALVIAALIFILIEGPGSWTAAPVATAGLVLPLALLGFVVVERRAERPMFPRALVRNRRFTGAAAVGFVLNLAFYGEVFVLSLFFQEVLGRSPIEAGLSFLPMTALITVSNLGAPRLARRIGAVPTIVLGEVLLLIGLIAGIGVAASTPMWLIGVILAPIGVGCGLSIPPLTSQMLDTVDGELAGLASGTFNAGRQVGGAVGVAVFGALLAGPGRSALVDGMHWTFAMAAILAVLGIALTPVMRKSSHAPTSA